MKKHNMVRLGFEPVDKEQEQLKAQINSLSCGSLKPVFTVFSCDMECSGFEQEAGKLERHRLGYGVRP